MRVRSPLLPALAALFAIPLLASAAHHEKDEPAPIPWDQAAVADLAHRLSRHAEHLRQAVRKLAGTDNIASGQNLASERLIRTQRRIRSECDRLKGQVEDGKGREDTANSFRRIDELHRDAAEDLRRLFLTEADIERVKEGRAMLDELRLYYTGKPDTWPDLVGPKRSEDS